MELKDTGEDIARVLYTKDDIDRRLALMGAQISRDYAGKDLLLVGVLKGAIMVMADLSRKISVPLKMDWMAVSSYGASTKSSGVVRILKDLNEDVKDKNVLIVEDILDSGLTLTWLKSNLEARGAASVRIAAMLRKPEGVKADIVPEYIGYDIPNEFVVGYGLDYAEHYRHLDFIGTLAPHVYGG